MIAAIRHQIPDSSSEQQPAPAQPVDVWTAIALGFAAFAVIIVAVRILQGPRSYGTGYR